MFFGKTDAIAKLSLVHQPSMVVGSTFFHQRRAAKRGNGRRRGRREEKQLRLREAGALPGGGEMGRVVVYQEQQLTHEIIGTAIEVHKQMGPGLLESAYAFCLEIEFRDRGWKYGREQIIPISYKGRVLDCGFRIDFLIEDKIIVEIKSVETLLPIHESQLITYLRLMNKPIGLLINFNEPVLKKGIRRCVNKSLDYLSSSGQGPGFA